MNTPKAELPQVGPGQQADIKKLKRLNRVIMAARFMTLVARVWWAWARHYPVAVAASAVAGLALTVTVPPLAPIAVGVFGLGVWWQVHTAGSRAQLNLATAAMLTAVFRWRWPAQAQRAELDRLVRGRYRVPRLASVRVDDVYWSYRGLVPSIGRVHAEVVPLDMHRPSEWPEMARRMQTRFGFAAHSYRPKGETRFTVAYANELLPDYAPFPTTEWLNRTTAHPDRVELGRTGNIHSPDPWMCWELDAFPHLMINGKTGSGKSTPIRCIQAFGVVHGAEQFVFSGKKSGEFHWMKQQTLASVASSPPGWAFMADHLWLEFGRRQQLLEDSGLEHWWQHPNINHRIIAYVDELMLVTGAVTKDPFTPYRNLTAGRLTELAAASRSCGMHFVMVTQYGIAQAAGTSGSLMRFNLSGRIVVGASNPDGLKAAFDEPVAENLANHLGGTVFGRCLYGQLNRHHGQEVTPGQIWHITQDHAESLAPPEPAHLVTDFDDLGAQQLLEDLEQDTKTRNGRKR